MVSFTHYRRLLLLLPGWIAFMAYLPALKNGFVWDDTYFITDLPYLRDPALWWQHIREPLFVSHNYFRPLPLLTFVIESQLTGPAGIRAFIFHFSNLLLHAINTTLVVLMAGVILKDRTSPDRAIAAAALTGLLFGLHPVLIESVSWISDRFDLMMATFIFLALLVDARIAGAWRKALIIGSLFLLALLCKETSVILLALLPLWQLARQANTKVTWRECLGTLCSTSTLLTWAMLAAAFGIYLLLRHDALGVFYRQDTLIVPGNGLQHILLMAKTLGWYALLLIWPFGQIGPVHPGSTPIALNDLLAWASLGLLVTFAGVLLVLLRRQPRAGFLAMAALVALAPVSNYVPLTIGDNMVHDRYLLLPTAFAVLALAQGIASFRHVRVKLLAAALWSGLAVTTIILTVPRWENDLTLWGWAHALEPTSNIARGNYVAALANNNYHHAVLDLCDEILREYPDNAGAMHDKALSLMRMGRDAESRIYNTMSLEHYNRRNAKGKLDSSEALNLRGVLDMRSGDWQAAEESFNQAIDLTPYLTRPHFNLALVYYERGDIDSGDREMAFVLRYDPPELLAIHRAEAEKKRGAPLPQRFTAVQGAASR